MPARKSQSRFIPEFHKDSMTSTTSIDLRVEASDVAVTKNRSNNRYPPVMKASKFPYVGMYACMARRVRKLTHPRDASFLTQEALPEWDFDSERGDTGSFMSILPRFSEDGDSCMCIAHTSVDEDTDSTQSNTSRVSSSAHSKLDIGVHFADEIGLPIQHICHYHSDSDSSLLSDPGSPERPNSSQRISRWDSTPCESWSPKIPKRTKRFPRWDNPSCEPSNRWIRIT